MSRKTVVCVVGTRPEAIKMAPVVLALRSQSYFDVKILATGQHSTMLDQALEHFRLSADMNLHIMKERQSLDHITASVMTGAGKYFDETDPSAILVHGDTTTTFASALAGFYRNIPVGHVEAGLRSGNMHLPFPEEMNRVLTDRITSWAFAPTELAKENLLKEGTPEDMIHVTGNTVIDALLYTVKSTSRPSCSELAKLPENVPFLLVTAHRRESWGKPLEDICHALTMLLDAHPELWMVIPMHRNPSVRETIKKYLENKEKAILCDPLDYPDFVWAMNASKFILSDSGGVQEEASAIKKPVLILRDVTERPEAVEKGSGVLVGVDGEKIFSNAIELLESKDRFMEIENKCKLQPFGDGTAAIKIAELLKDYFENDH
ncbi:MAG: UDP-N-acetylglucosamine 2-epimerase (non-hydrolyzing) [Synergistaceae bacterium]|nr:UDP-N-acetylglucosamine 2-epimerase (non-hydrolyzing) [Synergistaceae bacterium]